MKNYSHISETFIRKLIRIRRYIMKEGSGFKDSGMMKKSCNWLETHLDAWEYDDRKMAKFLLRETENIKAIMPTGASNFQPLLNEYNSLYKQALTITHPEHTHTFPFFHE